MPPEVKPYRVDLAPKVTQSDADHTIIWFTRGKQKGAFIFRPSEIERLEDLDDHFYPSFEVHQVSDLKKLMDSRYYFRATLFELRGIVEDVLGARARQRLK